MTIFTVGLSSGTAREPRASCTDRRALLAVHLKVTREADLATGSA
jgi:hypothetical protein